MINTSLFPYSTMPIRLEHDDSQKGTVTCFFQCQEHLDKYLDRYKINRKKCVILKADEQSIQPSPTDKKPVRQRTRKDDSGSSSSTGGRTKKLDSTGTVGKTAKPKAKPKSTSTKPKSKTTSTKPKPKPKKPK